MYHDQGIAGFYRGVGANIARACVLNATKMACYDITKGCKSSKILARQKWLDGRRTGSIEFTHTDNPILAETDVCEATGWGRKDVRAVFASGMVAGLVRRPIFGISCILTCSHTGYPAFARIQYHASP
jgi:hypothetical protein